MLSTTDLYQYYLRNPLVSTDSRSLPEGCMFFALRGPSFNGNHFAKQALEEGAAYAVVDEDCGSDTRLLRVENVLKSLQDLASLHRRSLDINVLAITGSNGKTTTKELTAAVLKKEFSTHYTQGNLNNHIGVPLTLLQLNGDHDFAVVEMGANHQGEIAELCRIAQPDFGLITNIGSAHLEGFGGPEGVKKGKGELYQYLRANGNLIFIQLDQPSLREILHGYDNIITYGSSASVQYRGRLSEKQSEFLQVEVTFPFHMQIQTQLTGEYNLDNILAAVAVGAHFGVEHGDIREAIAHYSPSNQRSQVIRKGELSIVLDAYNANPSSMSSALQNFGRHFGGPRLIALGEMLELGDAAAEEHQRIAMMASSIPDSQVILVGSLFSEAAAGLGLLHFINSEECAAWLHKNYPLQGSMLIKGSRGSKMEKLMEAMNKVLA